VCLGRGEAGILWGSGYGGLVPSKPPRGRLLLLPQSNKSQNKKLFSGIARIACQKR